MVKSNLPPNNEWNALWRFWTPPEQGEILKHLRAMAGLSESGLDWVPFAGPQTLAYFSLADELLFGGGSGGGKSDLVLGLAGTAHHSSLILRRVLPSMRGLIERSKEIYGASGEAKYNETSHLWRLGAGRMVEFGGLQYEKDREDYRGRPHDLCAWDEVTEFSESQFRFVNAWNRTTRQGQRCRVVATCNPPTTTEGRWVIRYWAPWLDDKHPRPARAGELRWFAVLDGRDVEVESGAPFEHKGEMVYPRSRTFIPALLADNPALEKTGYRATLQSLPEPLRSQMLRGDFTAGMRDNAWQVIPTAWVDAAIERGRTTPRPDVPLTCLGVDPSRGGDAFVISPRYGAWFGPLQKHTRESVGREIDGPTGAKLVSDAWEAGAVINIDAIGVGASVYDSLNGWQDGEIVPVNGAEAAWEWDENGRKAPMHDKTGRFKLTNVRTAMYWKLREALDPEGGQNLCLPDDDELRADLTAPTYKVTAAGTVVEPKHGSGSIAERLGRSPDCGDAVALAHWMAPGERQFRLVFEVG